MQANIHAVEVLVGCGLMPASALPSAAASGAVGLAETTTPALTPDNVWVSNQPSPRWFSMMYGGVVWSSDGNTIAVNFNDCDDCRVLLGAA
jgi:hypothetical protein